MSVRMCRLKQGSAIANTKRLITTQRCIKGGWDECSLVRESGQQSYLAAEGLERLGITVVFQPLYDIPVRVDEYQSVGPLSNLLCHCSTQPCNVSGDRRGGASGFCSEGSTMSE